MGTEIGLQFFQSAATVLPTIFIAFAVTSHILDPATRQNLKIQFFVLTGTAGIVTVAAVIAGFVTAELLTLIVLATGTPTFPVFVAVSSYVFLFAWFVGIKSLNPLFQHAVTAAEQAARDEEAKAKVMRKYRRFGNLIIIGSFVLPLVTAIIFYLLRA
jgi:hypothetical protein